MKNQSTMTAKPESPAALRMPVFTARLMLAGVMGVALAACFPPFGWTLLLPLALAGLLRLLAGATVRQALYTGLAFGMAFFACGLFWLTTIFGGASIALWAIAAAFPMLFCGLFVWLQARLPRVPLWLLAPVCWTGIEFVRSEPMKPNFAWMGLGYATVNAPWVAASASVFGSYGVTFGLVLLASLLAYPPRRDSQGRVRGLLLLAWGLLLLLPRAVPAPTSPLHIRLVQANSEDDESLFRLSQGPSLSSPDVIIWPEYSFVSDPRRDAKLWQKLTDLPRDNHCFFIFGAKDVLNPNDERAFRNTAYLLDQTGRVLGQHVKNHSVHFINDGVASRETRTFATSAGRLGIAICFDMDFPDVAQRLTVQGAEVLLVPADNPQEWGTNQHLQHRQMTQMRAIECGRWVATTDVAGSTFAVAPTGKITQSVATTEPTRLDVTLGKRANQTLFVRGGWRFGELSLGVLILLFFWSLLPARFRPAPVTTV